MRRFLLTTLACAALAILAAGCQASLEFRTKVNGDGSGSFTVAIELDRELVQSIEGLAAGEGPQGIEGLDLSGLTTLGDYFDCLESAGWRVARTKPGGGLGWSASRAFTDPAGFAAVKRSLRCGPQDGSRLRLQNLGLDVDYEATRSFLRTGSTFSGSVDLRGGADLDPEVLALVREFAGDVFRLRVVAELPGGVEIRGGNGVVSGGRAVWEPTIGSLLRFSASSSSLNAGALLLLAGPLVLLAGAAAWYLAGRRKPVRAPGALSSGLTPDPRPSEPDPASRLPAP